MNSISDVAKAPEARDFTNKTVRRGGLAEELEARNGVHG
jgi:hypothetical protein